MTVCDREGESRSCDVTLFKFFIIHIKPEIENDAEFSVVMYVHVF